MISTHENIPAVVIHEGGCFYLPYVLSQTKISNPAMKIFLIGDKKALKSAPCGIIGIDIANHSKEADRFSELYREHHRSFNSFYFENNCFRRSFILADFLNKYHFRSCWHLDSDNMIYTDLEKVAAGFDEHIQFSAVRNGSILSPHNSFWTIEMLLEYNKLIWESMTPGTDEHAFMDNYWHNHKAQNQAGGISDMITLTLFAQKKQSAFFPMESKDAKYEWNNTLCESLPELKRSQLLFHSKKCKKEKSYFLLNGKQMLNIHCQGYSKRFIPHFYTGNEKFILFLKTLRFFPRRIGAFLYHEILKIKKPFFKKYSDKLNLRKTERK